MDFGNGFYDAAIIKDLVLCLIAVGICVVLPIVIVWLVMRTKKNETDKRTKIILSAIEKNPNVDTKELVKMMTATPNKSVKKNLLNYLLTGCFMVFIGLPLLVITAVEPFVSDNDFESVPFILSLMCLGIGIAFLINYFVGKRFLAKEIEREENNLPEEE